MQHLVISAVNYQKLNILVEVLEPFEDLTDKLQGEDYVTISMVAPGVMVMLNQANKFVDSKEPGIIILHKFANYDN